jgi:hypothetical protein
LVWPFNPDLSLAQLDLSRAALQIVPGGHLWLRGECESAGVAIHQLHATGALLAGIDSGMSSVPANWEVSSSPAR